MPEPVIDVHLRPGDMRAALEADVAKGLRATPKQLPPKWFYDDRGSELFDAITRLPEYYPTEAERSLLRVHADEMVAAAAADTLVELGSGTGDKTRLLLDAMSRTGELRGYVPFDVSEATLRFSAAELARLHPGVAVHGVVGDFERHLDELPRSGRRMLAFLGSTIGNFDPAMRAEFFADVASVLGADDSLLLGTDLVKDPDRLVAAYDDSAGVTAEFNRNVLAVVNRELHADFDLDAFDHVALWDDTNEWIEMRLRSRRDQQVRVADLDLDVHFDAGEDLHTEISAKFRRNRLETELQAAGLEMCGWWSDGDFALSLSRPRRDGPEQ